MFSVALSRTLSFRSMALRSQCLFSSVVRTTGSSALHSLAACQSPSPATAHRRGLLHMAHSHRYSTAAVTLTAEPAVCLHDVHTSLTVRGLAPSAAVTLRATVLNDNGKKFCSHGQYVANDCGEVALDSDSSVGGSYTGVFPAGLLTNLAPAPGEFPFLRLYKKDPQQPFQIDVSVHAGHHAVSADAPPDLLTNVNLTRLLMAPGVRRRTVREGRVRGVLYLPPPHHGPAVGIVDMFGAVGGIMEFRAAMLASRGYAVLALPFFAYDDLPAVPDVLDLEYFEEAVNFVMAQDNVIPDRCGMISVSKSTDIALFLSTKMPALTAVVCIGVVGVSFDTNIMYRGELLIEGTKLSVDNMTVDEKGRVLPLKHRVTEILGAKPVIPIEQASPHCHYLLVAGSEDTWHCYLSIPRLQEHMQQHNRSDKIEGIIYEGAGHLIEPPYGPLLSQSYQRVLPVQRSIAPEGLANAQAKPEDMPGGVPEKESYVTGVPILFGGQAKPTCDAQVELWSRMQRFFDRRVKYTSPWYQQYLAQTDAKSKL